MSKQFFSAQLQQWFRGHHRPLPWKSEKDPYLIWLSEIILQQTRVEQGLPYFLAFRAAFPTVSDLAVAPEDVVMKLWQGLGYYSRARNLHETAKYIVAQHGGVFPKTYNEILQLKGVGDYTAAAIASFAYGLPHAVVDGNVYRVLSRFFGIDTPIDSTEGKKIFTKLANELLPADASADFNQAIMDFGATVCTPRQAACGGCPMRAKCCALAEQRVDVLPVKAKKMLKKNRFFHFFVLEYEGTVWLQKRQETDIWQQLYQFPMIETPAAADFSTVLALPDFAAIVPPDADLSFVSKTYKQTLTHQHIWGVFYKMILKNPLSEKIILENRLTSTQLDNFHKFAFPRMIDLFLNEKNISLKLF